MKKTTTILSLTLTLSSFAFAQNGTGEVQEEQQVEQQEVLEAGEYEVKNEKEISVNGIAFHQYQLQYKVRAQNEHLSEHLSSGAICTGVSNPQITFNRGLLLANMAGSALAAYGVYKINPHQDKYRHALAGYVIGNMTTGSLQLILPKRMKHKKLLAFTGGFGLGTAVGIGKELLWDAKGHGHVDANDAVATALGGLTGSITISLGDVSKAFQKKH